MVPSDGRHILLPRIIVDLVVDIAAANCANLAAGHRQFHPLKPSSRRNIVELV